MSPRKSEVFAPVGVGGGKAQAGASGSGNCQTVKSKRANVRIGKGEVCLAVGNISKRRPSRRQIGRGLDVVNHIGQASPLERGGCVRKGHTHDGLRHAENRPFQPHHGILRDRDWIVGQLRLDLDGAIGRRRVGRAGVAAGHKGFQKLIRYRHAILDDLHRRVGWRLCS